MRSMRLGQSLAIAVALSLTLLIVGVVGMGVGLRQGDVVPPDLHVSLSGLHIYAYTPDPIECRPLLPCPSPLSRDYYVVLVIRNTAPDDEYEIWQWMLSVPVQR